MEIMRSRAPRCGPVMFTLAAREAAWKREAARWTEKAGKGGGEAAVAGKESKWIYVTQRIQKKAHLALESCLTSIPEKYKLTSFCLKTTLDGQGYKV